MGWFCRHYWKMIAADVTGGSITGYDANVTLQCADCGKRQYVEHIRPYSWERFPSRNSAVVWIESLLPKDHPKVELSKPEKLK